MEEKKPKKISRRHLLIGILTALGGAVLAKTYDLIAKANGNNIYLPLVTNDPTIPIPSVTVQPSATSTESPSVTPSPSSTSSVTPQPGQACVVHIRAANATNFTGSGYYYNAVNQSVVDNMVNDGLAELTGKAQAVDQWAALFKRIQPAGYSKGQKIAIKVNFNNSRVNGRNPNCPSHDNVIDALPQPVLALLKSMAQAGVDMADVIIYDATGNRRIIPDYFRLGITNVYSKVSFVAGAGPGYDSCSALIAPQHPLEADLKIVFKSPSGVPYPGDRYLASLLRDTTYLINVPIMKGHSGDTNTPVSLAFKNHFGTINDVGGTVHLHQYINVNSATDGKYYRSDYSPFIDIYKHPYIANKTILVLGDGLFGAKNVTDTISTTGWNVFSNAKPNSLFFSTDPVASDTVMADILHAEGVFTTLKTYDYLFLAEAAGLGKTEGSSSSPGGNPFKTPYGSGYSEIQYIRKDL